MALGITVCKGCTERHVNCHSDCERYIKERDAVEEMKIKIRESFQAENEYWSYRASQRKRIDRAVKANYGGKKRK